MHDAFQRRKKGDLIETFRIINEMSKYARHFFNISPQIGNLLSRKISKTKSINQLDFLANKVIYFCNKFPNLIKKSISVKL